MHAVKKEFVIDDIAHGALWRRPVVPRKSNLGRTSRHGCHLLRKTLVVLAESIYFTLINKPPLQFNLIYDAI